jgi:hypothetical protein
MPRSTLGQLITFAIEADADRRYQEYIWVKVNVGDTIRKIAARRGHPEDARKIARLNKVRSVTQVLRHKPRRKKDKMRIRVPGTLRRADTFSVLAGDQAPRVVNGYQKLEVIDRPGRTGLTHFTGYDPITMEVPIKFEQFIGRDGEGVEERIALLERMAGRGNFKGASAGSAAILRLSTTNNAGKIIPLLPPNYQWSRQNPSAPLWRIADINWDEDPIRDDDGNRLRQAAVVTVQQHTKLSLEVRSVSERSRNRRKKDR